MRRIAAVTVGRSDYGIYRPLLRRIAESPKFELALIAAGMHLVPEFGRTIDEIIADGFTPAARVELPLSGDQPVSVARAMGLGAIGFAQAYEQIKPDLLIVLGDRYEMHAATVAAVPFLIPIAHIAGGGLTAGAIDDSFRHSMTKLASLHFVETDACGARVIQMGEDPSRVTVTGALGLDSLHDLDLLTFEQINQRFGLELDPDDRPLVVTFHPVTREYQDTRAHTEALLSALRESGQPVVFTYPNADTNGRIIIELIEAYSAEQPRGRCVPHLGTQAYLSLMAQAAAMVGNSSSGIVEAASFQLPVVNVGNRQKGRLTPPNVITTGSTAKEILDGIRRATAPKFRAAMAAQVNPYGDGTAAPRMIDVLREVDLDDPHLIQKPFYDLPARPGLDQHRRAG